MVVLMIIVEKLYSDDYYSIECFSLASGAPIKELARLENQVVNILNYDLLVKEHEFN